MNKNKTSLKQVLVSVRDYLHLNQADCVWECIMIRRKLYPCVKIEMGLNIIAIVYSGLLDNAWGVDKQNNSIKQMTEET